MTKGKGLFSKAEVKDLYGIFGLTRDCTAEELRAKFRRLALAKHPDRNQAPNATAEFQRLNFAYSILSDPDKRKRYDTTGAIDGLDNDNIEEPPEGWADYFRDVYGKVSMADLDKMKAAYVGSEEERQDILLSFKRHQGSIALIIDDIPFACHLDDFMRIWKIVERAVSAGEAKAYARFQNCTRNGYVAPSFAEEEAEMAEEMARQLGLREEGASLQDLVLRRAAARGDDLIARLAEKYSKPKSKGKENSDGKKKKPNAKKDDSMKISKGKGKGKGKAAASSNRSIDLGADSDEQDDDDDDDNEDDDMDANPTTEPSEEEFAAIQARLIATKAKAQEARKGATTSKRSASESSSAKGKRRKVATA